MELFSIKIRCTFQLVSTTSSKSNVFVEKLGFNSIGDKNYTITVDNLISYFSME